MNAAHLSLGENFHIGVVGPDAVGRQDVGAKEFDAFQILHRRGSVFLNAVGKLFAHFRDVDQQRRMIFARHRRRLTQSLLRTCVNGMRSDRGVNQRVALPFLQEFFRVRSHLGHVFVVRDGEIDPGLPKNAAESRSLGLIGFSIFEIIHVGESGGAAADHFGEREAGAPPHIVFGNVPGLGGENKFAQPIIERDVVFEPAHQDHRDVRMAINEAGDNELAGGVDGLFGRDAFWKRGGDFRADGDDFITADGKESILEDAAVTIHRDDGRAFDDEVYVYRLLGRILRDRCRRKQ